jgi:hypothetical protein
MGVRAPTTHFELLWAFQASRSIIPSRSQADYGTSISNLEMSQSMSSHEIHTIKIPPAFIVAQDGKPEQSAMWVV